MTDRLPRMELVEPILTPAEKNVYVSLLPAEQDRFGHGSNKLGSGANTDPGRVYLALGPPTKVTRLASSRILVPLQIWYYDAVPGFLETVPEAATVHLFGQC